MRNMSSVSFCHVCEENLWHQFFARVNCIDKVETTPVGDEVQFTASFVKIGQFREGGAIDGEVFEIRWERNGAIVPDLNGKHEFKLPVGEAEGNWRVVAVYKSKQIRSDPQNRSTFTRSFRVTV